MDIAVASITFFGVTVYTLLLLCAGDTTPSPHPDSPAKPRSGAEGFSGTQQEEGEGEDDPCRSEGLVQIMISNFSQLNSQVLSDPIFIRNLPWYVCVISCCG